MPICPKILLSIAFLSSPDVLPQSQTKAKKKLIRNPRLLERTRQKGHNTKGKFYAQKINPFWDPKVDRESKKERRQRLIDAGILEAPPKPDKRNWVKKGFDRMEKKITQEFKPESSQYEFFLGFASWFQFGSKHNNLVEDLSYDFYFMSDVMGLEEDVFKLSRWRSRHKLGLGISVLNGVVESQEDNGTRVLPTSSDWNMLSMGTYYNLQFSQDRKDLPVDLEWNLQFRWYGFQQVKVYRIPEPVDKSEHEDHIRFSPLDMAINTSFGVKYLKLFKGFVFLELRNLSLVQHSSLALRFGLGVSMVGLWDPVEKKKKSSQNNKKLEDKGVNKEVKEDSQKEAK